MQFILAILIGLHFNFAYSEEETQVYIDGYITRPHPHSHTYMKTGGKDSLLLKVLSLNPQISYDLARLKEGDYISSLEIKLHLENKK